MLIRSLLTTALLLFSASSFPAGLGGLDNRPGGLGSPGLDPAGIDPLLKKAEEIQRQAEEAQKQAEQKAGEKQQHEFVVRGYPWMAESCSRIKHPQALLNCEAANLDYLEYTETEDANTANRLYRRHKKSADKAIRLYRNNHRP